LTIKFSEAMQAASITSSTVYIQDPSGNNVAGTLAPTSDASVYTFTASVPYLLTTTYTLNATIGAKDIAGNSLNTTGLPLNIVTATAQYTVVGGTAVGQGSNGAVTPVLPVTVAAGSSYDITITPAVGYVLSGLTDNGVAVLAASLPARQLDGTYKFTIAAIAANHQVLASFAPAAYNVTVNAPVNGSTSPSGITAVASGANHAITITPATGFQLVSVIDNGADVTASVVAGVYTITAITADHTISVAFSQDTTKPLIASVSPNTRVLPSDVLTIKFSEAMQAASITSSTVYIQDPSGNNVAGTLAPTSDASAFTFISSVPYVPNTTYKLYATSGAKDIAGNGLNASGLALTITTRSITHTVTLATGANGTVVSNPLALAATPDMNSIIFTITPATGYHIADVKLDTISVLTQVVGSTSYTLSNVIADHTVDVSFAINTYALSTGVTSGSGTLTASSASPNYGTNPTVTITPSAEYVLESITDSFGGVVSANTSTTNLIKGAQNADGTYNWTYTINAISQDRNVTAYFRKNTITVMAPTTGTGSISPSGVIAVTYNQPKTFSITPATGYVLDYIKLDALDVTPTANIVYPYSYTTTALTKDAVLEVRFKKLSYTISVTSDANGTIATDSNVVFYGSSTNLAITPKAGYKLASLTLDAVVQDISKLVKSASGSYVYSIANVTANHTVNVTFTPLYIIAVTAGANGAVSTLSPTNEFVAGDTPTYTFTPAANYQVASVKVDAVDQVPVPNSYTFLALSGNHTISVTFALKSFALTTVSTVLPASTKVGGTVVLSSATAVIDGSVGITVKPNVGFIVTALLVKPVGGVEIDVTSSATTMVSGDVTYLLKNIKNNYTITAVFGEMSFAITIPATTGGKITASSLTPVYGSNATLTVTPDLHTHLVDLKIDGVSVTNDVINNQYTLSTIKANHTVSADFALDTVTLTASVTSSNGSISPVGATVVNYGGSQAYQITPASGAVLNDLLVEGTSVKSSVINNSYTVANVIKNMTITVSFVASTSATTIYPDGDINGDGKLDIVDALLALKMSVGLITPTAAQISHADVGPLKNYKPAPDGRIDIDDVVVLLQRAVGNIPAW
jgi:hypothetical protein